MHTVIVGGGFGGVYTLRRLRQYFSQQQMQITLISKSDHFLFTPLLHEAAAGNISHEQITEPLHDIAQRFQSNLVVGDVEAINLVSQQITVEAKSLHYDYLVLAMGASTNYFNIPGATEFALPLKDLHDSAVINSRLNGLSDDQQSQIAIIGGGPTGVELAMEVVKLNKNAQVQLVERMSELMPQAHNHVRSKSLAALTSHQVNLILGKAVSKITDSSVEFADGSTTPADLVIWTAGVRANTHHLTEQIELDKSGRALVDDYLRLPNFPNVFVVGDMASVMGKSIPMTAQAAVKYAIIAGRNIRNTILGMRLEKFSFVPQGDLFSLGRWNAVGVVFKLPISGRPAWLLWRCVYLLKYITFNKKLEVFKSIYHNEAPPALKDPR